MGNNLTPVISCVTVLI